MSWVAATGLCIWFYVTFFFTELRGIMLEHLLTTPTEEKDRKIYLEKVSECEKKNSAIIDKLQAQLDAAIEVSYLLLTWELIIHSWNSSFHGFLW